MKLVAFLKAILPTQKADNGYDRSAYPSLFGLSTKDTANLVYREGIIHDSLSKAARKTALLSRKQSFCLYVPQGKSP
ncbi:hypothetical protein G4V39_00550 [Thermosulfuriphilus ammonigenes]|uniref:Uncharacterized protein n=1 Tax=Thermosulfuriphilus ammonigenes TaxID=1936021 RepID=A0A6G7PTS4_9BACT|nr:hypothetical protein [Thermosulfuriphilus ammonigenes]MBA2849233.1 hypothetical protein [Thermosulfuriphilus ammonigenes]QIJ70848.1 hypothetical protein G4V39_00550 [Thermosulfuriphilus ammonigenes]